MKKLLIVLMCLGLVGCATMPIQEELANLDYGSPITIDYEQVIKQYFNQVLFDPYSAVYEFNEPQQIWYKERFSGALYAGYGVLMNVNAKNRMGGYVGRKPYLFIFNDNVLLRVVDSDELQLLDWSY